MLNLQELNTDRLTLLQQHEQLTEKLKAAERSIMQIRSMLDQCQGARTYLDAKIAKLNEDAKAAVTDHLVEDEPPPFDEEPLEDGTL